MSKILLIILTVSILCIEYSIEQTACPVCSPCNCPVCTPSISQSPSRTSVPSSTSTKSTSYSSTKSISYSKTGSPSYSRSRFPSTSPSSTSTKSISSAPTTSTSSTSTKSTSQSLSRSSVLSSTSTASTSPAPSASSLGCASPSFGTTQPYAIISYSTVTNTGITTVIGDVGVSPSATVSGFPPGVVLNGTIHLNDAQTMGAKSDALTLHNSLLSCPCGTDLTGVDLGGLTLQTGVYCFSSPAQLTGTLTLDGNGNANNIFIFKMTTTITTSAGASVVLINNASACKVFWDAGSSATINANTAFQGVVVAVASVTVGNAASVNGRLFALNGAVTLDTDTITRCA